MKRNRLSIYFSLLMVLLLAVTACQKDGDMTSLPEEKTGTLTLQFEMAPPVVSRSGSDGVVDLYYEVKGDALMPCEPLVEGTLSRAGDGNPADGGGMVDLHIFLVDGNDNIVAREYLYGMANVTTQSVTFTGLELGTYTAYAYANSEGNDWFTKPTYDVTSFTPYKDALLKRLDGTTPITVANGRMPLTGKSDITVNYGNNTGSIEMIRPVGRIHILLTNEREQAIRAENLNFNAIFPSTGYVFKQTDIYAKGTGNPYYALPGLSGLNSNVLAGTSGIFYEALIYETKIEEPISIEMSYKEQIVSYEQNWESNANSYNGALLIEIENTNPTLYVGMDPDGTLIAVEQSYLNDYCVWNKPNGNNKPINNVGDDNYYLQVGNKATSSKTSLKFDKSNGSLRIGYNSSFLNYNPATGFSASREGTSFRFYSVSNVSGGGGEVEGTIDVVESNSATVPLKSILRNQDVRLNIVFKKP